VLHYTPYELCYLGSTEIKVVSYSILTKKMCTMRVVIKIVVGKDPV
jgi:hypothetical protein